MLETVTAPPAGDRYASIAELNAAHDDLVPRFHANADAATTAEVITFMRRAAATGQVLQTDADRSSAQSLLNYWANALYRHDIADEAMPSGELADFNPDSGTDLTDAAYPFDPAGAPGELARGWRRLLGESLGALARNRLLAILGAAGAGRSHLLREVVWPEIAASGLPGAAPSEHTPVRKLGIITPTAAPLRGLARLLTQAGGEAEDRWIESLRIDPAYFAEEAARGGGGAILAVDQLGDLFRIASEQDIRCFARALAAFLDAGNSVIIVVDHDTVARLLTIKEIERYLADAAVHVNFDATELRQLIEEPAQRAGLIFEEGVIDRLVRDVQGDPSALALLQFTLRRLWKERTGLLRNRITLESYRRLGGGWMALQRSAEDVYQRPSITHAAVRRLFLALITPQLGSGFSVQPADPARLADETAPRETYEKLAAQFCEAGLLCELPASEGRPRAVTIAHAALVNHWPQLVEWLEERRVEMRGRLMLKTAADEYFKQPRPSLLWRGSVLGETRAFTNLNPREEEFLAASRSAEQRTTWIKRGVLALVGLLLLGWVWLLWQGQRRERKHKIGIAAESAEKDFALAATAAKEGAQSLDKGDASTAAVWFAHGLDIAEQAIRDKEARGVPARDADAALALAHRQRLSGVMRQMPRLWHRFPHQRSSDASASGEGRHLVTVSPTTNAGQGVAILWSLADGAKHELQRPGEPAANCAAISFDSRWVAVGHGSKGASEGAVQLWDVATRQPGASLRTNGGVMQVAFNRAGNRVAIAVSRPPPQQDEVSVWAISESSAPSIPLALQVNRIAFSPDGDRVAIACGNAQAGGAGEAVIWTFGADRADEGRVRILAHEAPVNDAQFNPADGRLIATASGSQDEASTGEARVWNALTGELVTLPLRHRRMVSTAQFSPSGRHLATASFDATARVWDIDAGRAIVTLPHEGWVWDARFSPDGRHLVTASRDRRARVWSIPSGRPLLPPLHHEGTVTRSAFTAEGRGVITVSKDAVRVWELETETGPAPLFETPGAMSEAALSPDGALVVTATDPGAGDPYLRSEQLSTVQVWKANGERVPPAWKCGAPVNALAFSADGQRVAAAANTRAGGGQLTVWKTGGAEPVQQLDSKGAITLLAFSAANPERLLAICRDGEKATVVRIWTLGSGGSVIQLPHTQTVRFAAFSPDGSRVVTCAGDASLRAGEARLWNAETGAPIGQPMPHREPVTFASFSADGARVATASVDDTARVWSAADGAPLVEPLASVHSADLTSARFSPDGRRIVTASYDSTAVIFDWAGWNAKPQAVTLRHAGYVNDAVFSADGARVATCGFDRAARVWDAASGELIATLPHAGNVRSAVFNPAGDAVTAVSFTLLTARPAAAPGSSDPVPVPGGAASFTPVAQRQLADARAWSLAIDRRPVGDLRGIAGMIAAQRMEGGKILPGRPADAAETWAAARAQNVARAASLPQLDYHLREASLADAAGQWAAAGWQLAAAVELKPGDSELLARAGKAFTSAQNWIAADYYHTRLLSLDIPPGMRADALKERARARAELGQWEQVAADCAEWRQLAPKDTRLWIIAAEAQLMEARELRRAGRIDDAAAKQEEAIRSLQQGIQAEPGEAGPWQRLATLHLHRGDLDSYRAACRDLLAAISPAGENGASGSRVAWPCLLTKEPWSADSGVDLASLLPAVERSVELEPRNYYRVNSLGVLRYRLGDYRGALRDLDRSRKDYADSRARRFLLEASEETMPIIIAQLEDGRPVDQVFLAMTHYQLSLDQSLPADERTQHAADAHRWLRKAQDAHDAYERGRGTDAAAPRRIWNHLDLGIFLREANALVTPPQISAADE